MILKDGGLAMFGVDEGLCLMITERGVGAWVTIMDHRDCSRPTTWFYTAKVPR